MWRTLLLLLALFGSARLTAQPADPPIQTRVEALAMDAAEYAHQHAVPLPEAMARLQAQEDSVPAVQQLADAYRARLAGISIEHSPDYRIVFLLTGSEPVPTQTIPAGGLAVPIEFRTGAEATRDQIVAAITAHQAEIRAMLSRPPGLGLDPRTGDLVVIIGGGEAAASDPAALRDRLSALTGVPISLRLFAHADANLSDAVGGGRLIGPDAVTGVRSRCTTGFVVTDGTRTGIATAAHCPDQAVYRTPDGTELPLEFVGQWGARYQDVQIHLTPAATRPLFHPDTARALLRPVTGWRNRAATRAGDFVCHRGERTGYSCAEIALVDYAPPGDLCGGPCTPDWVTVAGPTCNHGDSGGPVFSGTIAFGLVKGGSYRTDGSCSFYFYMSTDYLPPPWTLLYQGAQPMPPLGVRRPMKIATYNVNGVNGRLPVLLRWLDEARPDIVCLQELKAPQEKFPAEAIAKAGYEAIWHGQKSWNGVAILSRVGTPVETRRGLPGDPQDLHSRYIEAAVNGILVGGLYLPNGNPKPGPKFDYKLAWFERLIAHAADLIATGMPVVLAGDYNVMPTERDVYKPERWLDDALFAPEARAAWFRLVGQGWTDALRTLHPDETIYTFFDYFRNAFARNAGLRIDHFLLSPTLAPRLLRAEVDREARSWEKTSDHCPVWIELTDE